MKRPECLIDQLFSRCRNHAGYVLYQHKDPVQLPQTGNFERESHHCGNVTAASMGCGNVDFFAR